MRDKTNEVQKGRIPQHTAIVAVVLLVLLMPVVWYVVLYREPLNMLKQISSQTLEGQEQGIHERRAALSTLQALDTQYSALDRSVIQTIQGAIPRDASLPELIVNISELIRSSGGHLEDFSIIEIPPSREVGASKETVHQLQVTIRDISYEAMKQLIRTVYQNGRVLTIRSIEYTPQDSSVAIALEVYSLSEK